MTGPHDPTSWAERGGTQAFEAAAAGPNYAEHNYPRPLAPTPGPRHRAVAVVAEPAEPTPPSGLDPNGEPVIIAHAVTVVLAALVSLGWATIPNTAIDAIGTIVALALSTVGTVLARARVSPIKGGLWAAVEGYVADLVMAELAKRKI